MAQKNTKEPIGEWIKPDDLKPWDKNPRQNENAIASVANSIERFGFGAPIVARKKDRRIIAGHTRWKAARLLALDFVPVRFLNLSDKDAELYALADNKLNELADWDFNALGRVVRELSNEVDFDLIDLKEIGFDEEELARLIGDVETEIKTTDQPGGGFDDEALSLCPNCGHKW